MNNEYDVDAIVADVENAVSAGKYRLGTEEEETSTNGTNKTSTFRRGSSSSSSLCLRGSVY
jgi:hypothetical protein